MSSDLACVTCEELWNAGSRKRVLALLPVFAIGLGVGLAIVWAVVDFMSAHGGGLILSVFAIGVPVVLGGCATRWVDRRTFRRKFLAGVGGAPSSR